MGGGEGAGWRTKGTNGGCLQPVGKGRGMMRTAAAVAGVKGRNVLGSEMGSCRRGSWRPPQEAPAPWPAAAWVAATAASHRRARPGGVNPRCPCRGIKKNSSGGERGGGAGGRKGRPPVHVPRRRPRGGGGGNAAAASTVPIVANPRPCGRAAVGAVWVAAAASPRTAVHRVPALEAPRLGGPIGAHPRWAPPPPLRRRGAVHPRLDTGAACARYAAGWGSTSKPDTPPVRWPGVSEIST